MLGNYIGVDMSFKEIGEMYVDRILFSLNVRRGIQQQFTMIDQGHICTQILEFEGVPFYCWRCHVYSHIIKGCPLPFSGRAGKGSTTPSKKRTNPPISDGSSSTPSSMDQSSSVGFPPPHPIGCFKLSRIWAWLMRTCSGPSFVGCGSCRGSYSGYVVLAFSWF
jgi:hypothetical protein